MDPISAIVGAIVAGAATAATEVASAAVKDSYEGLKTLIVSRFKRKGAVLMVEENPRSENARNALTVDLTEVKADRDPEVLKLAEKLAAALQQLGEEKLARANVKVGDVAGFRNAIVRGISASGSVEVGDVTAHSGDAIVENVTAGGAAAMKN